VKRGLIVSDLPFRVSAGDRCVPPSTGGNGTVIFVGVAYAIRRTPVLLIIPESEWGHQSEWFYRETATSPTKRL
jgi:hypothetical protein